MVYNNNNNKNIFIFYFLQNVVTGGKTRLFPDVLPRIFVWYEVETPENDEKHTHNKADKSGHMPMVY